MLLRLLSLIIFVTSLIPPILLFSHLSTQLALYNNTEFQNYQSNGKWVSIEADIDPDGFTDPLNCFSTTSSEILDQRMKIYRSWRATNQDLYTAGLYLSIVLYFLLRVYGYLLEYIYAKKPTDRIKWLLGRVAVIILADSVALKVLHSYRLIAFSDFTGCLSPLTGSNMSIDFWRQRLISDSPDMVLVFLNMRVWEKAQFVFSICLLGLPLTSFVTFGRRRSVLALTLLAGRVFLVVLGSFGLLFGMVLTAYNEPGYFFVVNQITTIMLFRVLITVLDSVLRFAFSLNGPEYEEAPESYRFKQLEQKSELHTGTPGKGHSLQHV